MARRDNSKDASIPHEGVDLSSSPWSAGPSGASLSGKGLTLGDLLDQCTSARGPEVCGAKTRAGTPCRYVAGYKTDHLGQGRCRLHGGATPIKHGRRSKIKRTLRDFVDLGSYEALEREFDLKPGGFWDGTVGRPHPRSPRQR